MRRSLLVIGALAFLVAACDAGEAVGGSRDDAMRIADRFLAAVEAGDTDAAWLLVYAPNRTARFRDDRASFDTIVSGIDLSGLTWEAKSAWVHDGHYHVRLDLDPLALDDDLAVFVDVVDGSGEMQVDIEPLWGTSGILGR